jgi:Mrp family chromosome partitioning ATPase
MGNKFDTNSKMIRRKSKMSENGDQNRNISNDERADKKEKKDFSEKPHELSNIRKVIGIVSGIGGVGKSLITSMLAVTMNRRGYQSAILDADITGPSIPKAFGINQRPEISELGLFPAKSKTGIQLMSINLLLENETDPVIWRGPRLSGVIKQFWSEVIWGDVDFMFIDMPPGTGDVPLTVFQSIKPNSIIIVASPQELVSMIVAKAVKMAESMKIPILGLVENMSYFKCPECNKEYKIFGESSIEKIAAKHQIQVLAKLPIDPKIAASCDKGMIEFYDGNWLKGAADVLENQEV